MKLSRIAFFVLAPFFLLSCTDILNVEPVSQISVESFWDSEEDARGGINGMYTIYRDEISYNLLWWGEARSGTLSFGMQAPEGRERYFQNNLTTNNAGPHWRGLYWGIHQANLGIKYIPDIEFNDEDEKNRLLAQAYAMRAHLYYIMARTWGAAPLVTEPTEGFDPSEVYRPRNSVEEMFELIKSDIDESLSLFSSDMIDDRSVWSAPSVHAMKADVYLWTGKRQNGGAADFETALAAAEEASQANAHLLDDFGAIFDYGNKKNEEILFAAHYGRDESGSNYGAEMYIRGDQIPSAAPADVQDKLGVGGGLNRVSPSEYLRDQYSEDDLRAAPTFTEVITVDEDGTEEYVTAVSNKFRGIVEEGSRIFVSDLVIYRYADVLLMIAEAKNALGQDPTTELNQVRNRAGLDDYSGPMDQEALDDAILQERLLEFAHEGKQWWDVVRFGRAFDLVPSLQGQPEDDCLLLWPLSTQTMTLNSQLEQNPCYEN